jgi:hypothetical protein
MAHVIRFFRLVRLTESRNRIFFGYFGSLKLGTEFFGFGSFGFGSNSFCSVPRFRFFVPRLSSGHGKFPCMPHAGGTPAALFRYVYIYLNLYVLKWIEVKLN